MVWSPGSGAAQVADILGRACWRSSMPSHPVSKHALWKRKGPDKPRSQLWQQALADVGEIRQCVRLLLFHGSL